GQALGFVTRGQTEGGLGKPPFGCTTKRFFKPSTSNRRHKHARNDEDSGEFPQEGRWPDGGRVRRDAGSDRGGLHRRHHDPGQQRELDVQLRRFGHPAAGVRQLKRTSRPSSRQVSPGAWCPGSSPRRRRIDRRKFPRAGPNGSARCVTRPENGLRKTGAIQVLPMDHERGFSMPQELMAPSATPAAPTHADDSLGIDRAFVLQLARMPLFALLWVGAAFASHAIWAAVSPEGQNYGPLVVICFGMVLAAFIDGWALKVPNWVTLPLVLSGWILGLLHDGGITADGGAGGFSVAFL